MKDNIITSPLTGIQESCYVMPINETLFHYKDLSMGFETTDLWKVGDFDFEAFEETLPELYKDIKQTDDEGRVWYPQILNTEEKGIVFIVGTNKDDWEWCGILHTLVSEEEKDRFKKPDGSYIKYKNDPKTLQKFGKFGFVDALDYVGMLN